ncbi:MAG TPA: MFS transporter [Nocardioidaceae bacterium]|nr:MFS transporter [Nocardioidaceae bacterium]
MAERPLHDDSGYDAPADDAGETPGTAPPREGTRPSSGRRARTFARGVGRAATATGRGARAFSIASFRGGRRASNATGRAAGFTLRQARRATHAEGAGDSGLFRLIELHAFNSAGDAAIAISLAGTLFFQVPTNQAHGQVALFLAMTMAPFAVVAPLIGPFLDRYGQGRRWAIGATMASRAFLCWVLADAVTRGSFALFPAALGCLVASKAYGVTRAAAVPRLLPKQLTLVKANSRISLSGLAGGAISAPLAVGASQLGPEWGLRYAFLVFIGGTIVAILLPSRVDSATGEAPPALPGADGTRRRRLRLPHHVVIGLRANSGLRLMSGFLTIFMAFLLRDQPFPRFAQNPALLLALVVGSAGLGSAIGIGLGNVLRNVKPEATVVVTLLVDAAVTVFVAIVYTLPTAVLLGLVAGFTQSFGKLCLDSMIQREVSEQSRATAFARSETLLQMSWVAGGFIGIALPLVPHIGLGVAAAVLLAFTVWTVLGVRRREEPS